MLHVVKHVTISLTGYEFFAIRTDFSRHRLLANRRSEATGTSLYITIQFVLLLTTVFFIMI